MAAALDLYLYGRRFTDAIKTIATAPLSQGSRLSSLILASCALEAYFEASLATSGQQPNYPSRVPFYRRDLSKLYENAQTAGLTKVPDVDELIENAKSFHLLFKTMRAGPEEIAGGEVLLMSYLDVIDLRPPSPDVLERLDEAVEAHVRGGAGG